MMLGGQPTPAHPPRLLLCGVVVAEAGEQGPNLVCLGNAQIGIEAQRVLPVLAGLISAAAYVHGVRDTADGARELESVAGVVGKGERGFVMAPSFVESAHCSQHLAEAV